MNRIVLFLLSLLCPTLVLAAEGSLSFAPPASDFSVVFLGNLFGVVDGVLHGTGSQIMGTMFAVFNSAVLALGGIIIMYTLLVSTMNTAHEGQMLGQKWSSIWIPVRSTLGLALLIPKASGYCLMQIFVMWIVVQGVGAADKVWEAALGYLNRGGVIIQANKNPAISLLKGQTTSVPDGALTILSGQVCMLGLQKQIEAQRQEYLNAKQSSAGPCYGTPSAAMNILCTNAVPDFLSTVNAVAFQNNSKNSGSTSGSYELKMPNFETASPFNFLNGICGKIAWNDLTTEQVSSMKSVDVTQSQLETSKLSRAIAIQQMYVDLSSVAQVIINNNPAFSTNPTGESAKSNFSAVAKQQFGVPYTANGEICYKYDQKCAIWGPASNTSAATGGVLFNGTEFQGAIADYNGIMTPVINLLKQSQDKKKSTASRQFITEATTQGWIMAGAYFFDLVKLNGSAIGIAGDYDSSTGLDKSTFDADDLTKSFASQGCQGTLCTWFNNDPTKLNNIKGLIDGSYISTKPDGGVVPTEPIKKPDLSNADALRNREAKMGQQSSTVYGFINNSTMVQLPGQPGLKPLSFANTLHVSVDTAGYRMQRQDFDCGGVKIVFFSFCLGRMLGDIFYNLIFLNIYNIFLSFLQQMINQVIMLFLLIPLQGMAAIFKQGVETISAPGINPVVALANMGTMFINFSGNLWIALVTMSVSSALIPGFGVFIFALIALAMPLLLAWVGIMVGVGFITAYYIPLLPYMIFTFGALAWLIAVIEAMVAAPIVALGVTHPEGHDAFGKGEQAIMILMNVFLRPSMMVIGFIAGIALSYVGVWILNAGFDHAIGFIQHSSDEPGGWWDEVAAPKGPTDVLGPTAGKGAGNGEGNYTEWAGIYAYFFSVLMYTTLYLIIVQRAFSLISYLPDKVLRWIGGAPESMGEQAAQWAEEGKQKVERAGERTQDAQGQISKQLGGFAQKGISKIKGGGSMSAHGGHPPTPSTPSKGDE